MVGNPSRGLKNGLEHRVHQKPNHLHHWCSNIVIGSKSSSAGIGCTHTQPWCFQAREVPQQSSSGQQPVRKLFHCTWYTGTHPTGFPAFKKYMVSAETSAALLNPWLKHSSTFTTQGLTGISTLKTKVTLVARHENTYPQKQPCRDTLYRTTPPAPSSGPAHCGVSASLWPTNQPGLPHLTPPHSP